MPLPPTPAGVGSLGKRTMRRKFLNAFDAVALALITALALFPVAIVATGGLIH